MLDHDQRVPKVPQPQQRLDEPPVVPLVQADRGLVQDVEHADQARADLRGQPDALRLPSGQGPGGPVQGQVVQAHVDQELESCPNLFQDPLGDHVLAIRELELVEERDLVLDRLRRELPDADPPHGDCQGLGLEARALAGPARHVTHVLLQPFPRAVGLGQRHKGPEQYAPQRGALRAGGRGAPRHR